MFATLIKQFKFKLDLSDIIDQVKCQGQGQAKGQAQAQGQAKTAIKPQDYEALLNAPHLVTLNMDLPLVYLYITNTKGINRSYYDSPAPGFQAFTDNHRFGSELFQKEMLFSGYLFDNMYIVEDIVINMGEVATTLPIDKRLSIINNILDHNYVPDPVMERHKIVSKDYVEYEYLRSFLKDHVPTLPYAKHINGLRFCPFDAGRPILITDATEIRPPTAGSKPKLENKMGTYVGRHTIVPNPKIKSCVFSVRKTDKPDVYELYLTDASGTLRYYDIACIPNKKVSQHVKTLVTRSFNRFSCVFNSEFGRWTPNSQTNSSVNCILDLQ
jgi:hypothetical protein